METLCDNIGYNKINSKIIEDNHSMLLYIYVNLAIEDVCKIDKIRSTVEDCRFVSIFLKLFYDIKILQVHCIKQNNGSMFSMFPDTRLIDTYLTFQGLNIILITFKYY